MPSMRKRRLLLATSALVTVVGCGHDKKPRVYANPKGSHYAMDAGVDSGSGSGSGEGSGSGTDEKPPAENK
jgi:hypothetical protein